MAKDEQGFDPDLDYTKVDNPFWDATPGAHPAFDRGVEHATKMITKQLQKIILGPDSTEEMTYATVKEHLRLAIQTCTDIIVNDALVELTNDGLFTYEPAENE